jgi:hypothetical protein
MDADEITDARLDEALRRQPRWDPPAHFARAVVARIPPAGLKRRMAPSPPGLMGFRAVVFGGLAAGVASVAGLLLSWAILTVMPDTMVAATAYQMLLDIATATLIEHATLVAWITAAVMVWIAGTVTGRAQEWI